jgi:transposase-like protein
VSPKRGAYPPEFRREAVRKLREGRDLHELARELGVTPGSLRVWLVRAEGGSHRPRLSRENVLAATESAHERFDRVISAVPVSALGAPMGFAAEAIDPWRVADAIAHVAHYKARVIHRLVGPDASTSAMDKKMDAYCAHDDWNDLKAADPVYNTMDAFTRRRHGVNHLVFERWRDAPPKDVLAWHRSVHRYAMTKLTGAPDDWFEDAGGKPRLTYSAVSAIAHHSDTHLKDIERALRD